MTANSAVRELLELGPPTAFRANADGTEQELPVEHPKVGAGVRARPGSKVSLDGRVMEGGSRVDESMLTGKPMPATKRSGDEATGGTLDTTLSKIVQMIGQAQRSRVPIQRLAGTSRSTLSRRWCWWRSWRCSRGGFLAPPAL